MSPEMLNVWMNSSAFGEFNPEKSDIFSLFQFKSLYYFLTSIIINILQGLISKWLKCSFFKSSKTYITSDNIL